MNPKVVKVKPLEGHKLFVEFENSETRIFDVSSLLDKGVFKELKNPTYFSKVRVVAGAVQWPNEQDLSYDTLYLLGEVPSGTTSYDVAN